MTEEPNGIRMIEFFSGIGGMRFALQDAIECQNNVAGSKSESGCTSLISCTAYEISLYANQTYSMNFNEPISSFKNDHGNGNLNGKNKSKIKNNNARSESKYSRSTKSCCCNSPIPIEMKKAKTKQFKIYTKLIEQLQPWDVGGVDLWTMSPPCQPFTNTR